MFLGIDPGIKVTYAPAKQGTRSQLIAKRLASEIGNVLPVREQAKNLLGSVSAQQEVKQLETTVKNNKPSQVAMLVYDQLPSSNDSKIKVMLKEPDIKKPAPGWDIRLNKSNNLEWRFKVDAGAEVKVPLSYTVEWPLNTQINQTFD